MISLMSQKVSTLKAAMTIPVCPYAPIQDDRVAYGNQHPQRVALWNWCKHESSHGHEGSVLTQDPHDCHVTSVPRGEMTTQETGLEDHIRICSEGPGLLNIIIINSYNYTRSRNS